MDSFEKAKALKEKARELGFILSGITQADPSPHYAHYQKWIETKKHAGMDYLERRLKERASPCSILPSVKSILSLALPYSPPPLSHQRQALLATEFQDPVWTKRHKDEAPQNHTSNLALIASYALGSEDYHPVVVRKLKDLETFSQTKLQISEARGCVDTAPLLERSYAERAGLGWIGKNTMLINSQEGSYFFLAELLLSEELPSDGISPNQCGTCTRCLDACPTNALAPYEMTSDLCISYQTIENKESEFRQATFTGPYLFGCDICQIVCPWNHRAKETAIPEFYPNDALTHLTLKELKAMDESEYKRRFSKTALKRPKWSGFLRNFKNSLKWYEKQGASAMVPKEKGRPSP